MNCSIWDIYDRLSTKQITCSALHVDLANVKEDAITRTCIVSVTYSYQIAFRLVNLQIIENLPIIKLDDNNIVFVCEFL